MSKPSTVISCYLFAQAAGTMFWWLLLWIEPRAITWFQPSDLPPEALEVFWLPDLTLLVVGSCVTACGVASNSRWSATALWALAAVVCYPTLYCLASSLRTDEAWVASALMSSMAGLTLVMATATARRDPSIALICPAEMDQRDAVSWTLFQVVLFWGLFLWILPKGIMECASHFQWATFHHPMQSALSVGMFCLASMVGLWSGLVMAYQGHGTPLPTATAAKLVAEGPYRFVRNPMAIAGILQGVAVGWYHGSFPVIVFAVSGAFLWHGLVRPIEEADLRERFGSDYEQYCARVGLWIPRLRVRKA